MHEAIRSEDRPESCELKVLDYLFNIIAVWLRETVQQVSIIFQ